MTQASSTYVKTFVSHRKVRKDLEELVDVLQRDLAATCQQIVQIKAIREKLFARAARDNQRSRVSVGGVVKGGVRESSLQVIQASLSKPVLLRRPDQREYEYAVIVRALQLQVLVLDQLGHLSCSEHHVAE